MADFEYVDWQFGVPVTSTRLFKMSENDQYLKDAVDALPKGVVAWAESTTEKTVYEGGSDVRLPNMHLVYQLEADRLYRITYRQKGVKANADLSAMTAITIDNATVATAIELCRKHVPAGPSETFYIFGTDSSPSEVSIEVTGTNVSGGAGSSVRFRASSTSPRQLVLEDLGPYVDSDPGPGA